MTLPLAGHPVGAPSSKDSVNELDKIESAYRFLLADLMPFGRNARITLEHGGQNESNEHYETVTYWYGLPAASLVKTDVLHVGDEPSERQHAYASTEVSAPYQITSRYEWGVDRIKDREIFPTQTMTGRVTRGTSQFVLNLNDDNWGVLLRRTLDYQYPNQCAEVFVADGAVEETQRKWESAGTWYLAGSNTCVYSNPKDELGATEHKAQTSNRRFRDDEFLIGRDLTRGREAIAVKLKFVPIERPLFPGAAASDIGWSEIRYDCYCYVMPKFP
jgi:hypothetical protein